MAPKKAEGEERRQKGAAPAAAPAKSAPAKAAPAKVAPAAAKAAPAAAAGDEKKRRPRKCRFCREVIPEGVDFQKHNETCAKKKDPNAPKVCRYCDATLPKDGDFKAHNEVCKKKPAEAPKPATKPAAKKAAPKAAAADGEKKEKRQRPRKCRFCKQVLGEGEDFAAHNAKCSSPKKE